MGSKVHLGELLREVTRLYVQLQRDQVACCNGTTLTQCTILTELERSGPLKLADLGRKLGLDKSWTSRAVENLVQEGLLLKTASTTDLRTVIISLSPAGAARYEELNHTLDAQASHVLEHISATERASVQKSLELLLNAVQNQQNNSPVYADLNSSVVGVQEVITLKNTGGAILCRSF